MQAHRQRCPAPRSHPKHQSDEVRSPEVTCLDILDDLCAMTRSVIGIIAIPGMMTGAILGGSSVEQAARLQMVIMFMISASTALSSIVTTLLALGIVVDSEHRVRVDRIDTRQHVVWRAQKLVLSKVAERITGMAATAWKRLTGTREQGSTGMYTSDTQMQRLLG